MDSLKQREIIIFRIVSVSLGLYILWRLFFTIPVGFGVISFVAGLTLAIAEAISILQLLDNYKNTKHSIEPECPVISPAWYPDVDVLIATHNESYKLLHATVNGCIHMEYPDKEKVHIYICDDMNRPEIKRLANEMGVGYFGLEHNTHKKAGNLNHALENTHSPLVATFDADMIPMHSFLMKTVPYFFLPKLKKTRFGSWVKRTPDEIDPNNKIGFVQTPQSFYNPDLFQYNLYSEENIPNEQDYFFREINVGRNRTNSPIYAGSNTVISRNALNDVGNIVLDCITEDFATGMLIQSKGYTTYAISEVLAHGLSPSTFRDLIRQRERWGRGCIQSFRRVKIFQNTDVPLATKLSYLNCILYWWTFFARFIFIIAPLLYVLFHVMVFYANPIQLILIWLPSYLLQLYVLRKSSGNIRNTRWSNTIDTILFPYLMFPIILESLGIKLRSFNVTRKDNPTNRSGINLIWGLPHIILAVMSVISLVISIHQTEQYGAVFNVIIIYWLFINLYSLIMAILFMSGRNNLRNFYRYNIQLSAEIEDHAKTRSGKTLDISENGLRILLDNPIRFTEGKGLKIKIKSERYSAVFEADIVHVRASKIPGKWEYSFIIQKIDELNLREFEQILYDRMDSFPKFMNASRKSLDDLSQNIIRRTIPLQHSARRKPRLRIHEQFLMMDNRKVMLEDFDYENVRISSSGTELILPKHLDLPLGNDVTIFGVIDARHSRSQSDCLYHITNTDELFSSPEFLLILNKWEEQQSPVYKPSRKLAAIPSDELDVTHYL